MSLGRCNNPHLTEHSAHLYGGKMDAPVNVPVDDPNADTEW